VEHYEIAQYGTLCTFTRQLGHDDAVGLLHDILEQERRSGDQSQGRSVT